MTQSCERSDRLPLPKAMLAVLRSYWTQAQSYQKFLYAIGAWLIAGAICHTGVMIVTGGSLEGDISWRKPILFGESFGLTAISIAWIMTFLPKQRVVGWLLLFTSWTEDQRTRVVVVGALSYVGLVAVSASQTFSGLAPFDLSLSTAVLLGLGVAGLLGAYALAFLRMRMRAAL
jgi:hypothetical protein